MRKHVGIFPKDKIKQIFDGTKQIEIRYSANRISPYGEIESGDIVYIKPPGEEIVGQFLVKKVIFFNNLETKDLEILIKNYQIEKPAKFEAKFGTIIFFDQVEIFITAPIKVNKRNSKTWEVL